MAGTSPPPSPRRDPSLYRLGPRRALTDDVYEAIKAQVMDQVIPAGDRMSIDGLARELGVSPTPVREAMTRLESEGLATKEALKGYRSAPLLSQAEFDDLFRFRFLIEPWAAQRAAEQVDDAGRHALASELDGVAAPRGTSYDDYRKLTEHDERFHSLIAELSGSAQVQRALERTHCHLHIFRLSFERSTGHETLDEHRAVVDAIARGHGGDARDAMCHHLETAMAMRLRRVYDLGAD